MIIGGIDSAKTVWRTYPSENTMKNVPRLANEAEKVTNLRNQREWN